MSYKIKISISIMIFLLLNLALIFLLRNFILEIKNKSSEIFSKRSDLLLLEKKAQNSEEFSKLFQKEEKNFGKINLSFINSEMPVDFISFIEKTAKGLNLSLQLSITPSAKEQTPWPAIGFQINLTGFYSDVFKFLKKLYYSPYLIEVQSLEISKVEKEITPIEKEILAGNVKTNLLIQVYAHEK